MSGNYILGDDGRTPKRADLMSWVKAYRPESATVTGPAPGAGWACVAAYQQDGVRVSTVFLGLDHSFGRGEPILFETMVFGGKLDGEQERYSTWDEAEAGHKAMVERVKAAEEKARLEAMKAGLQAKANEDGE